MDVPGHVRFIKNMLAGVGAVDACLFVVAATEGWKPQSEEHLRILELLGIAHGVIALDPGRPRRRRHLELVKLDLAERVAGTFLGGAEVVGSAAAAGVGVDELRAALDRLVAHACIRRPRRGPGLWIDRVFAAKGAGTVVTGTLTGGSLEVGDEVVVEPGHRQARVRALQTFNRARRADRARQPSRGQPRRRRSRRDLTR